MAREICARLLGRHGPLGPTMDAEVEGHWQVVAAQLEPDLIDEAGDEIEPSYVDRELGAYRDWRARHPDYVVPPAPRSAVG